MSSAKECTAPACSKRHYAKGYCKRHYTQVLRHGRLTPEREPGPKAICAVDKCGRKDTIHGHCRKHARQIKLHGRLTPEREHVMGSVGCKVRRCPAPHRAKGLCSRHYNNERLLGNKLLRRRKAVAEASA